MTHPDLSDFDRIRQLFLGETIYQLERCEGWLMGGLGGLLVMATRTGNGSICFATWNINGCMLIILSTGYPSHSSESAGLVPA